MKTTKLLFIALSVVLLLAMSGSFATAQEPLPPDNDPIAVDVKAAAVGNAIDIQGRLTNASGNPVPDGTYTIVASLYDVSSGGVARCSDDDPVPTTNGLFNMTINNAVTPCASSDINGDQLWLGIKVGSDAEMTPRQAIHAVPYAYNVKPGAILKGATSYLFVPGTAIVKDQGSDSTRWNMSNATALVYRGTDAGSKYIYIPITIPAVLYGQPVKVTNVRVYYKSSVATTFIDSTTLIKQTDADTAVVVATDSTDRASTTATYFDIASDDAQNILSVDQGLLALRFYLVFTNDTDYVQIAGVRLTLVHNYTP